MANPDPVAAWSDFQVGDRELAARREAAFASLRSDVERVVLLERERERPLVERQRARLAELRRALANDARPLVHTSAFAEWLEALLRPRERRWMTADEPIVPADPSSWSLLTHPEPLGLHRVEHLESAGYNDEEYFLSKRLVVEATLGARRFYVGFEVSRRFALHEDPTEHPADEIEYVLSDLDEDWPARSRDSPKRPTWEQVMHDASLESLSKQVFAIARFAAPILDLQVEEATFRFP